MKNGELKIESGIPIPKAARRSTGVREALRLLKVGDSVLAPASYSVAWQAGNDCLGKGNFIVRSVDAKHSRVWRTK